MAIKIDLEDNGSKGRYVTVLDGIEAEMTFSRLSDKHIIVDHTGVPDDLGGKGVGKALAEHVVNEAREKGFKITPLCPFLAAQYRKHPDWADTLAK